MEAEKPDRLYGREREWAELVDFVSSPVRGATLGLVYGRRRQGKTLMLELLARRTGGFYFGATVQSDTQSLADLGRALGSHVGSAPFALDTWWSALEAILRLGEKEPVTAIIDEFPYLVAANPALPSYLQQALNPLGYAKEKTRTRLILCGSALTTMSQLLGGGAPLRGRASLELVVRPFDFREAAGFWGLHDPELAFRVHALVGGTPAYLEMAGGAGPRSVRAFDDWVVRRLLNPSSAMFREGGLLLREEPSIVDPTSYAAVLTAISAGRLRRSEVAADLGRPVGALSHLFSGLESIGLIERVGDALRDKRTTYRIAEPIVRLHQLLLARNESRMVTGRADAVWRDNADTVQSRIYGPHFEDLARQWCLAHADPATTGGPVAAAQPTQLACREHKQGHELDVVAWQVRPGQRDTIVAVGEAKGSTNPVGAGELRRLEHLRELLPSSLVSQAPRLLLFGRAGFTRDLAGTAASRADVELIDLDRLYHGS